MQDLPRRLGRIRRHGLRRRLVWRRQGISRVRQSEGRSLVITRTRNGEDLVRRAQTAGYIALSDVDIDEVAKMQPFQARRKMLIVSRLAALALLARPRPRYEGLNLMRAARMAGILETSKSFLGTLKRLLMSKSARAGRRRERP